MSQPDAPQDCAPATDADQRHAQRDKLLLSAICLWPARQSEERLKVRNVSATGLMAEGTTGAVVGEKVLLELRNVGPVEGMVAWVQGNRFGVAFTQTINPSLLRSPAEGITVLNVTRDYYQRGPVSVLNRQDETRSDRIRRV